MNNVIKVFSILLVCCLVLSLLPTGSLASNGNAVWLEDVSIISSDRYTGNEGDSFIDTIGRRNGTVDIDGNDYEHGLEAWVARWNYKNEISWVWCTYDLGGRYKTLSGAIGILKKSYNKTNFNTTLEIWGDSELLYLQILTPDMKTKEINLDIDGIDVLKINLYDNASASGGTSFALGNFQLTGNRNSSYDNTPNNSELGGHTYQVFDESLTWEEAKSKCEMMGGYLATITSQEEQDIISSMIQLYSKYFYWLGATDVEEEGMWEWISGEPWGYENWVSGQPDNHSTLNGSEEHYLTIERTKLRWNDLQNEGDPSGNTKLSNAGYVCEWDSVTTGEFRFVSNVMMNCIAKNMTFDIYAGYYVDDTLRSGNYQATVSDDSIIQINSNSWDSSQGEHLSLSAKKAGSAILTIVDLTNNVTGSLDLYVVDSEVVCSFDNVPQMTIEEGKTTNFYNYSGMIVDDFKYREIKAPDGSIDHYEVTMTVYNTLDLYGAITAYDADGNIYDYCIIDKFTSMDSSFVDSVESLIKSTGDLFYLIGNNKYYSGESISKKTEIKSSSPINVPAGGYLEISNNNATSPVALFANLAGITMNSMATTGSLASSASQLIDAEGVIVDQLLIDAFTKNYVDEKVIETIKKLVKQELKNGNWSLDTFGDGIQSLLKALELSGIDFIELLQEEIVSVKGLASIAESVSMDTIPTGQLIKLLYGFSDVGELIIEATAFIKSVDYPMGIYLYTSAFSDVSTKAYYSDSVQWALINDITSGTSATTFDPNLSCTRAQMVTFLWRAAGEPAPQSNYNPFTDVKPNDYCYNAVLWAVEQGITSGTSATTFSPNESCTRSQAVTLLYRCAGKPSTNATSSFDDVSHNAYYADAVRWAVANGITSGTSTTTFTPSGDCTRAQIVTFLYRYMG